MSEPTYSIEQIKPTEWVIWEYRSTGRFWRRRYKWQIGVSFYSKENAEVHLRQLAQPRLSVSYYDVHGEEIPASW